MAAKKALDREYLLTQINAMHTKLTQEVDEAILKAQATAVIYRGSVADADALPTSGQKEGDMYNLADTDKNVVWVPDKYDALAVEPDDFATNFANYFKVENDEYVALSAAETFNAGDFYAKVEAHWDPMASTFVQEFETQDINFNTTPWS